MEFKNIFRLFNGPQFQSRLGLICTMVSVLVATAVLTQVSRPSLMISSRWISKIEIHSPPASEAQDNVELELQFIGAQIDKVSSVLEGLRRIQMPSKLIIDRHNQELFSVVPTEIELGSNFLKDNRAVRRAMILNWVTQAMSAEVFKMPVLTAILADFLELVISGVDQDIASLEATDRISPDNPNLMWMDRLATWTLLCKEGGLAPEERFWCHANHGQAVSLFSLQSFFSARLYQKYLAKPIISRHRFLLEQLTETEERVASAQFGNLSGDFSGFSDFVTKMENILDLPAAVAFDSQALVFQEQDDADTKPIRISQAGSDFVIRNGRFHLDVDELREIKTQKFIWQSCQMPALSEVNQAPVRFTKLLWIKVCKSELKPQVESYISNSIADFANENPSVEFFEINWDLLNDYNKVTGGHAAGLLNALAKKSWTSLPLFEQRIAGLESATLDPRSRMYNLKAPLEIISAFRLTP